MKIHDESALLSDLTTQLDNLVHVVDHDGRTTISRLIDAMAGQPAAQDTANPGSGGATAWCDRHEREVHVCHRRCRTHDRTLDRCRTDGHRCYLAHDCVGVPIKVTDPTGEAAILDDQARADLDEATKDVTVALERVTRALQRLQPYAARQPSEAERASLHAENTPGCQSCARLEVTKGVRKWVPPHPRINGPTQVPTREGDPRLAEPMVLCKWCYEHVGSRGCVPSLAELRDHHAGNIVDCRHKVIDDWSGRAKAKKQKAPAKTTKPTKAKPKTKTTAADRQAAVAERRAERLAAAEASSRREPVPALDEIGAAP